MNTYQTGAETSNQVGPYKYLVLTLTTLSQTSIAYVGLGIGALVPVFQQSFHLSAAQVGVAVSANNIGIGLTALFFGYLVDRVGDKVVMVTGGLMTGVTILLATLSQAYWVLILLLVATGMWGGAATPAGSKAIFNYFLPRMRGMAMGVRQMGIAAGSFIAALTLPLIARGMSWRGALLFAGSMAILANLAYLIFYQSRRVTIPTQESTSSGKSKFGPIFRNPAFWYTSIGGTTLIGAQFVIFSYTQLFLHSKAHIPYTYTFYFLAIAQVAGMAGRVLLGVFSDRFFNSRRKPILLLACIAIILLSLLMLLVNPAMPWWLIVMLFLLMGFVAVGWNGLWVNLVSELVDSAQASSAIGAAMSLLQAGVLIYPLLFGFIVDTWHSYDISWIALACCVAVGFFLLSRVQEGER